MNQSNFMLMSFYNFDVNTDKINIKTQTKNSVENFEIEHFEIEHFENSVYYLNKELDIPGIINGFFTHSKSIVLIDRDFFFKYLFNSFKDDDNIHKQYKNDVLRSVVYINNHRIYTDKNDRIIKNYLQYKYSEKISLMLLALCTQAILSLPFIVIQKQLHKIDKHLFLAENRKECHIYPKKTRIHFNNSDNRLDFLIEKYLRVVTFINGDGSTQFYIKISIKGNLYKDKYIIMNLEQIPIK